MKAAKRAAPWQGNAGKVMLMEILMVSCRVESTPIYRNSRCYFPVPIVLWTGVQLGDVHISGMLYRTFTSLRVHIRRIGVD